MIHQCDAYEDLIKVDLTCQIEQTFENKSDFAIVGHDEIICIAHINDDVNYVRFYLCADYVDVSDNITNFSKHSVANKPQHPVKL